MGYAFEMGARVIIYIMSNTEMDRVISSFIQEKSFLVCMVQSFILKISTIRLGRLLVLSLGLYWHKVRILALPEWYLTDGSSPPGRRPSLPST